MVDAETFCRNTKHTSAFLTNVDTDIFFDSFGIFRAQVISYGSVPVAPLKRDKRGLEVQIIHISAVCIRHVSRISPRRGPPALEGAPGHPRAPR